MEQLAKVLAILIALVPCSSNAGDRPLECGKDPAVVSVRTPDLTKSDVFSAAAKAAIADGYKLSAFEAPTACFNSNAGDWYVSYMGRAIDGKLPFGHHFSVVISDADGKARIIRGL